MSLMEAMAHSVPVVSTKVGGIAELVEDQKSGILISPGDVKALADALSKLLSDPSIREEMGQAGASMVVAEFSQESQIAALGTLFK